MGDDDVRAPRLTPVNVEDDDPGVLPSSASPNLVGCRQAADLCLARSVIVAQTSRSQLRLLLSVLPTAS